MPPSGDRCPVVFDDESEQGAVFHQGASPDFIRDVAPEREKWRWPAGMSVMTAASRRIEGRFSGE